MSQSVYPVPADWAARARVTPARYAAMVAEARDDPDTFWRREAQRIDWIRPFTRTDESSFDEADFGIRWFADGTLNLSANCLDRHLETRGDAVAIIWEPDDPAAPARHITFRELHRDVCRFANALKAQGARPSPRTGR